MPVPFQQIPDPILQNTLSSAVNDGNFLQTRHVRIIQILIHVESGVFQILSLHIAVYVD